MLVAGLVPAGVAAPRAKPAPSASILSDSTRSLVALEFRDSPTQGLVVTGGMLAVPDSSGRFPAEILRYQPRVSNPGARGQGAGDCLVFTDLEPGTYRVALVALEEAGAVHKFLTKKAPERYEETCRVYADSLPALTFVVRPGESHYLGRLIRRLRPSLQTDVLWQTSYEWDPGDERRALGELMKHKSLAPWRAAIARRLAQVDSVATPPPGGR
jgi:hypothetical protein